jgi:hypothetical protein
MFVAIKMGKRVVRSAVAQCIIVKFVTNEKVKPVAILTRHRLKFDPGILLD